MKKKTTMWAIAGIRGLYTGTWHLRKDAITYHCEALEKSWEYCKKKGDKAVRVIITYTF